MEASGSVSGPPSPPPPPPPPPLPPKTTKRKGILSRIWNRLFGIHGDDFEKRLKHISKEEASVLNRMRKRSLTWAKTAKELIIISVLLWVVALGYAIMTTRSLDLDWKMRAFRVLPMFLCPALCFLAYSALASFVKMLDRRDQKTLERLQDERQAKINELKEKTNYYITQQLIQRYDPDPAAKAAAATVLASKLGADSGLKVFVGEESKLHAPKGKSNDVELMESSGLRNRKQVPPRSSSHGSAEVHHSNEVMAFNDGEGSPVTLEQSQSVTVEHHHDDGSASHDGGWFARIAALLVGEDPTHSYALICGNCHIHNGLARKEDFPYITYYCPHCHALNRAKHAVEGVSDPNSLNVSSNPISTSEVINNDIGSSGESVVASGANIEGEGVTSENTVS